MLLTKQSVLIIKKIIYHIFEPIIVGIKNYKIKADYKELCQHYECVIEEIKKTERKKIRFAAYVVFDSTYGMDGVFSLMRGDDHWESHIVIIPDMLLGKEQARKQYLNTKEFFYNKYGKEYVLDGWNMDSDEYYDLSDQFDMIYYANPYDARVHEFHSIKYGCKKQLLTVYVSYGFHIGRYTALNVLKGPELNYVWKIFADTVYTYDDYKRYQVIKGENVVLSGYSKMDNLHLRNIVKKRKKVLVCFHHTVDMDILPLSNFLNYYELLLRLPELFPEMDFVFRPHPLLFSTLLNHSIWSKEKINRYLEQMARLGIEYSVGGDYFELFSECDAIINDCGSFTIEWLFTGKPGCFVYNKKLKDKHLTKLMRRAVDTYHIARSEQEIISFLTRVYNDNDEHHYEMDKWVKDYVAINYPNVSQFVLGEIDILNTDS